MLRVGFFDDDKSKYSQIDNVSDVQVFDNGALLIEHHTNQVTCYANGTWRWFYSYPEEDAK